MHTRLSLFVAVLVATMIGVWPAWALAQAAPLLLVSAVTILSTAF